MDPLYPPQWRMVCQNLIGCQWTNTNKYLVLSDKEAKTATRHPAWPKKLIPAPRRRHFHWSKRFTFSPNLPFCFHFKAYSKRAIHSFDYKCSMQFCWSCSNNGEKKRDQIFHILQTQRTPKINPIIAIHTLVMFIMVVCVYMQLGSA